MTELDADLVLEGGGVKGIGLLGAVAGLESAGYRFKRCAGTSAGAIVASLVAAGMPADKREQTMRALDYEKFQDDEVAEHFGLLGKAFDLVFHEGIYRGEYFHQWIEEQLAGQGVHTFADLAYDDPVANLPPERQFKLVVVTSDVSRGAMVRLPWDYPRYGLDPAKQKVADAVRASMSVPFFFRPALLHDPTQRATSLLTDGGMLSNFPIDSFDAPPDRKPRWPTFGIKLGGKPGPTADINKVHDTISLGMALVHTMMDFYDRQYLNEPGTLARTLFVDTGKIGTLDFGLTSDDQNLLFGNGQAAATGFLKGWNWDKYIAQFRS